MSTTHEGPRTEIFGEDGRAEKAYIGYIDFFLLQYWQRMWTYQELALPKDDPICVYGSYRSGLSIFISRGAIQKLTSVLDGDILKAELANLDPTRSGASDSFNKQFSLNAEKMNSIARGISAARKRSIRAEETKLFMLMKATLGRQCSDPRDRIYALHGIAEDFRSRFPADYGKNNPASKVLLEAAIWSVELQQDGHKLFRSFGMHASRFSDHLSLPSWIPDFDSYCSIDCLIQPAAKGLLQRSPHDPRPTTHDQDAAVLVGRPGIGVVASGEAENNAIPASIGQFLSSVMRSMQKPQEPDSHNADFVELQLAGKWKIIKLPAFQHAKEGAMIEKNWHDEGLVGDARLVASAHHGSSAFGDLPSLRITARNLGECDLQFNFGSNQLENSLNIMGIMWTRKQWDSWNLTLHTMDRLLSRRFIPSALLRDKLYTTAAHAIATGYAKPTDFWKDLFHRDPHHGNTQSEEESLKAELKLFILTRASCIRGISAFWVNLAGKRCLGFAAEPVKKGDIAIMPLSPYRYPLVLRQERRTPASSTGTRQEGQPDGTWDNLLYHRMVGAAFMDDLVGETDLVAELAKQRVEDFYIR